VSAKETFEFVAMSLPAYSEVALSVYELHGTSALNFVTSSAGIGGVYHVGVEVYGLEWSFGGADNGTGVYMVHIGESSLGNFHSRIPLGKTKKTPEQVFNILDQFRRTWRGSQYHLFAKNCVHFSTALTQSLGFNNQPEWINALAAAGAGLTGAIAEEPADLREEEDLSPFDDDELEDFAEDGDHLAMLELAWRRAQEYTLEVVDKAKADARYEDLLVELRWAVPRDDVQQRNVVLGLMGDRRLQRAVAECTAGALGLNFKPSPHQEGMSEEGERAQQDLCPVKVSKFQALAGLRISVTCRVTGGENMKRIKRKPTEEAFAAKFKHAIKNQASWRQDQKAVMDKIVIETAPGQPPRGHRIITSSRKGGEIYFPRKEFVTPDSVHRTLAKLQQLRATAMEQSAVHRSLKAMQCTHDRSPWWAT